METEHYIKLADGTYAVVQRSMTWGEAVIILLLVALVFLHVYALWISQWPLQHQQQS